MHRTILGIAIVLLGASASAQDVLTIGSGIAQSGGTAAIPVSVVDQGGTSLGVDAGTGNRIQGFAFKVLFPTELIASVSFVRAGVATLVTPSPAAILKVCKSLPAGDSFRILPPESCAT